VSTRALPGISVVLLVLALAILPVVGTSAGAAPSAGDRTARLAMQNVDWMTADQAARLNLSFPVMVPTWIPGPFGGAPSIQAGGGYYSLYWMNAGGAPTFLQISGQVGAAMPVGSPADLNVRLSVNASVQGYEAIHDVTSIYDNVWWVAGGVLYTVSSNNMTGTDSLSLANSLVPLQVPAAEPTTAPEVPPTPTTAPEVPPTPTTAPEVPPTPTTAPAVPPTPTTAPEVPPTPTTAPEVPPTPTTAPEVPPTPTTAPAVPPTPTTAPAVPPIPTERPSQQQVSVGTSGEIYNAASVPSANVATLETYPSASSTLRATGGTFSASGAAFITGVTGGNIAWQAPSVDRDTLVEFTLVDEATGTMTAWSSIVVNAISPASSTGTSSTDTDDTATDGTDGSVSQSATTELTNLPDSEAQDTDAASSDVDETGSPGVTTESTDAGSTVEESEPVAPAGDDALEEGSGQSPLEAGTTSGSIGSDGTGGPPLLRSGDGTAGPDLPRGDGTGGIRQIALP
jgi:hypothetical protein